MHHTSSGKGPRGKGRPLKRVMRIRGSKKGAGLGAMLAALLAIGVWSAPTAAADSDRSLGGCGFLGQSICGHGGVNGGNRRVYSCDTYANGEGFLVFWGEVNGYLGTLSDPNGAESGCGEFWAGTNVSWYQVCRNVSPLICRPRVAL